MKLSHRFADRKWLDSLHQLQHALHLPWDAEETSTAVPSGRLVLAVTLVSVAAALVLVVAP